MVLKCRLHTPVCVCTAVVQLCIINPAGYFCMECNPKKSGGSSDSTNGKSENRESSQNLDSLGDDIEDMRNYKRQSGEDKYVTFDLSFKVQLSALWQRKKKEFSRNRKRNSRFCLWYEQEDEVSDPRLPLLQRVDENPEEFSNMNNYRNANGGLQRQGTFRYDTFQSSNPLRSTDNSPPPPPTNGNW